MATRTAKTVQQREDRNCATHLMKLDKQRRIVNRRCVRSVGFDLLTFTIVTSKSESNLIQIL